jgi:hypothetical protein
VENLSNIAGEIGNFATDASVDTAADGAINNVIDGVAEHIPGGGAVEQVMKTGVDLAANNAINAEIGKVEGMFGHGAAAPAEDGGGSAAT